MPSDEGNIRHEHFRPIEEAQRVKVDPIEVHLHMHSDPATLLLLLRLESLLTKLIGGSDDAAAAKELTATVKQRTEALSKALAGTQVP